MQGTGFCAKRKRPTPALVHIIGRVQFGATFLMDTDRVSKEERIKLYVIPGVMQ